MSTRQHQQASALKLKWAKDPDLCWISTFNKVVSCSALTRQELKTPLSETELDVWEFIETTPRVIEAAADEYEQMQTKHDVMSATKLFNDIRWEKHGLSDGKGGSFLINNTHIPILARILNEVFDTPFLTSRRIDGERLMNEGPFNINDAKLELDRVSFIKENLDSLVETWEDDSGIGIGIVIDTRTMTCEEAHRVLLDKLVEHYTRQGEPA